MVVLAIVRVNTTLQQVRFAVKARLQPVESDSLPQSYLGPCGPTNSGCGSGCVDNGCCFTCCCCTQSVASQPQVYLIVLEVEVEEVRVRPQGLVRILVAVKLQRERQGEALETISRELAWLLRYGAATMAQRRSATFQPAGDRWLA